MVLKKVCSLVRSLCILHNFCINENIEEGEIDISSNETNDYVPQSSGTDSMNIMIAGGIGLSDRLDELLDGGQHFDDTTINYRVSRRTNESDLPRTKMLEKVISQGYESRPNPRTY